MSLNWMFLKNQIANYVYCAMYAFIWGSNNVKFPKIAVVIVIAEFCERFSYSGMKAFLALYLKSKLMYTDEEATEIYHAFGTLIYFFPILGAVLADNYFGKYRTILYMMFVYAAGNILVALTAIPPLALPGRLCTMLGLLLITIGTGGIKPCVGPFGGEQFKGPQKKHISLYFMMMYFTMCTAALISKSVSPILRAEIQCFGDKDCYSIAFGLPGIVMLSSIVIFVGAKKFYHITEPSGNVIFDVIKCLVLGLKNKWKKSPIADQGHTHWLDSTSSDFDFQFIGEVKRTLLVLMLYIPLPAFWALIDQMGSRWTLQAARMNGEFGWITVKPDQVQVLAPIFILILIPVCQKVIYPFFYKMHILRSSLEKMAFGGLLAAMAFICSAVLELHLIKTSYPVQPHMGESQIRIFNGNNHCSVIAHINTLKVEVASNAYYVDKHVNLQTTSQVYFNTEEGCYLKMFQQSYLNENEANSFFINNYRIIRYKDSVTKSRSGLPSVRFLIPDTFVDTNITLWNTGRNSPEVAAGEMFDLSKNHEVFPEKYRLINDKQSQSEELTFAMGGVYTVMVTGMVNNTIETNVIVITQPNKVTMLFLLPQYLLISMSEVFFAVTGMEFTFNEAPDSMKSVLQAVWLLTEAAGNILIIVITRLAFNLDQANQSFLYAGQMLISILVFLALAKKYRAKKRDMNQQQSRKKNPRSNSEVLYLSQCD